MSKIPVNMTLGQLKRIVKEAEDNIENNYYADDNITFHVQPYEYKVTQPVQKEPLGQIKSKEVFSNIINTTYSKS